MALAISDERDAVERIARFRLLPEPAILVTVGMAYEGMDAPEVRHVACLTQIRSVPWLEQMVARATRFDPLGGDYERQTGGGLPPRRPAVPPLSPRHRGRPVRPRPRSAERRPAGGAAAGPAIGQPELPVRLPLQPLRSAATELRFETVLPRWRPAESAGAEPWPDGLPETPSQAEQRLRRQVGQMVAAQVVEDVEAGPGRPARGYHAYNAVLKRVFGKPRAVMTLAELEAVVGWLERNRVGGHLGLLRG